MAADIKSLQQQLMKENLDKYAEEGEKRTKLAMAAIEGKADSMSATGKAYFEMLSKVVEASEKATGKQLKYSTDKINDISKTIQQASDLNDVERDLLQAQVQTVQDTFKANTQNGSTLVSMAKKTLEDNAVDITSIVAGLTSNNPVIMFATKWIGDSIKQRREEATAQRQAIDEAMASVDTTLIAQREDNADWREAQDSQAFAEEENRREEARAREDQTEALEAIADKEFDVNVESADGDGGFWDNILGMMGLKGGIKGLAAMGAKFAPALSAALPIAAIAGGVGMAVKDGFDIYSNLADDDIATGIEGEDVGGVAGSAIGGAIGFALGGPLGAGIGMMIGNLAGEFIGEAIDPDMDAMAQNTANQIRDRQQTLVDAMNVLEQQLANGVITQEQYNAARAGMQEEIDKVNAQALASDRVFELQAARDRAAQAYNDLNTQIERMEEAGVAVPDAMYDQLAVAEQSFYDAEDAFETAADELDSQVDPSWWDSLSAGISSAITSVTTSVDNAFESVRNSLTGLAIPDIEGMSEDERAALQAKVNALPEGLESAAGLTQEQLVLLAEDLEMSPEDLAAMDSAAVLRATAMDSIFDGAGALGEMAGEVAQNIGDGLWNGAERLGIDDELTAVGDYVGELVSDVTEGAKAYWDNFKDTMGDAKRSVLSFFGWGDDDEEEVEEVAQVDDFGDNNPLGQVDDMGDAGSSGADTGGSNLESENMDYRNIMQLNDLNRLIASDNFTKDQLEEQKALLESLKEDQGRLNRINKKKLKLVNQGLRRIALTEDVISGNIAETYNPDTGQMEAIGQGFIDSHMARAERYGLDTSEAITSPSQVGQTLNGTQAEIQDGQAEENMANATGGGNGGSVNMITQNNSSQSVQRVQPVIPVRNSSDDYRGSAIPAN